MLLDTRYTQLLYYYDARYDTENIDIELYRINAIEKSPTLRPKRVPAIFGDVVVSFANVFIESILSILCNGRTRVRNTAVADMQSFNKYLKEKLALGFVVLTLNQRR